MRLSFILFSAMALGTLGLQSVVGPAKDVSARHGAKIEIAPDEICDMETAYSARTEVVEQTFEIEPAYTQLSIVPAQFGTALDEVIIVPAHREGAVFETERTRVVVTEPSRRMSVVPAQFKTEPVVSETTFRRHVVRDGELTFIETPLDPMPTRKRLVSKASIMAVRVSAGIEMRETKRLVEDGTGVRVPAETAIVERRTLDSPARVEAKEIPAREIKAKIQRVATPSRVETAPALCTIAERPELVRRIAEKLAANQAYDGKVGEVWDAPLIDAFSAWQTKVTGRISAGLLMETVPLLFPNAELPSG